MYKVIRPLLFTLSPEAAHTVTLKLLDHLPIRFKQPKQPVAALGLTFSHPLGLAAGLDKNGAHLTGLAKLGFAFIEVGTLTPKPQKGNPKPRLFRLPQNEALINRMGFNNAGVDAFVKHMQKRPYAGLLGVNIGKNKETPLHQAAVDYTTCLHKVYPYASYITLNISSPNTPDLRQLQQQNYLHDLLREITMEQMRLADQYGRLVPLVVKVSPDENEETLKHFADEILAHKIAGIIATNTTSQRPNGLSQEAGGLSGRPLQPLATTCLRQLKQLVGDEVTLIGVGGIHDAASAQEKLAAGATLLQVYTGLIYRGPRLITEVCEPL